MLAHRRTVRSCGRPIRWGGYGSNQMFVSRKFSRKLHSLGSMKSCNATANETRLSVGRECLAILGAKMFRTMTVDELMTLRSAMQERIDILKELDQGSLTETERDEWRLLEQLHSIGLAKVVWDNVISGKCREDLEVETILVAMRTAAQVETTLAAGELEVCDPWLSAREKKINSPDNDKALRLFLKEWCDNPTLPDASKKEAKRAGKILSKYRGLVSPTAIGRVGNLVNALREQAVGATDSSQVLGRLDSIPLDTSTRPDDRMHIITLERIVRHQLKELESWGAKPLSRSDMLCFLRAIRLLVDNQRSSSMIGRVVKHVKEHFREDSNVLWEAIQLVQAHYDNWQLLLQLAEMIYPKKRSDQHCLRVNAEQGSLFRTQVEHKIQVTGLRLDELTQYFDVLERTCKVSVNWTGSTRRVPRLTPWRTSVDDDLPLLENWQSYSCETENPIAT